MGHFAQGSGVGDALTSSAAETPKPRYFWGPFTGLGLVLAVAALLLDQASKLWLLEIYDIRQKGAVTLTPFFDLIEAWNTGISYSLFQQETEVGQWALVGLKLVAVILLWIWMTRVPTRWSAASLGLIIGGAVGNGIDRVAYGAVFDFAYFHITTASWNFSWYVFNLADVAIVVGVAGLLYESLFGDRAVKAPRSGP
jgi:signal peptidase II